MRTNVQALIRDAAHLITRLSTLNPNELVEFDEYLDFQVVKPKPPVDYYETWIDAFDVGDKVFFDYNGEVRVGEVLDVNHDGHSYLLWDYHKNNFRRFDWYNIDEPCILRGV